MNNYFFIIFTLIVLVTFEAKAFKLNSESCAEYRLGSNWYCENKEDERNEITASDILNSPISPQMKAEALKELHELQLRTAVITQNRKDDERFLETQYLIAHRGTDFARRIQRLIESDPKFSDPQSYYRTISDQMIKDAENEQLLMEASKRYSLVFIYSSTCGYCARQYPILMNFKSKYDFKILGISVDESSLKGLDKNIVDKDIALDPLVKAFPTILLLDMKKSKRLFIAKGLTTLDQLESQIVRAITDNEANNE